MAETRDETVKLQGTAQYWQMELDSSDQSEKDWRERGRAVVARYRDCLLYTSPSPRDQRGSRMPSSA